MMNVARPANRILAVPTAASKAGLVFFVPLLTLFFLLSPAAPAQTFTLLHQFRSGPDGINPEAGVVLDAKGNLYGTTLNDGAFASGTVFKVSPAGNERVLYSFTGINGDGAFPFFGSLVRDSTGNLYGTTESGGIFDQSCPFGCGIVFKVDASGNETVLYRFTGTSEDGTQPWFGLVRNSTGTLYGSIPFGGTFGGGSIFKITPAGNEAVLYDFEGSNDGGFPEGSLLLDAKGDVYGTTSSGGSSFEEGTVFKVAANGKETVLYSFTGGTDGGDPGAGLIRDPAGNLYGTTQVGGTAGFGTVFKLNLHGQETVVYSFTGGADGAAPFGGSLVRDSAGNLYGVTSAGGDSGFGVVFEIDTTGTETVLHSFSGTDGKIPYGTLALDKSGNLYGTTYEGGAYGGGVVFKIAP
jgi:uncharacterized repeat protein (TIGR03803 family)